MYEKDLVVLNQLQHNFDIDDQLYEKIKLALRLKALKKDNDIKHLLNSLPRDIQQQFYIKIYKDKISKIKLFQNPANSEEDVGTFLDDKGIAYFASLFEIESYSPGQFVYKEEYISDNLFFITKGRVRLIEPNNFFKFEVKQGDIFGDLEFFRGFTRLMKAVNPSKILNKNLSLVGSVAEEAVARSKKNWFDTMGGW